MIKEHLEIKCFETKQNEPEIGNNEKINFTIINCNK